MCHSLGFSEESVNLLANLCKYYNAKIVLSSSWREGKTLAQLKALFSMYDFSQYIIDVTPKIFGPRSNEIKAWLKNNSEQEKSFVVLDDCPDILSHEFGDRFLYCKDYFTAELYQRAINVFINS